MSNETKKTALPKLRFPEFEEAEEWEETELGANGAFLRGLTYSSKNVADNGLLVLRSSNIQDENLVFNKDLVFVNINCSPSLLLQKGDVAICMSNGSKALVGKSGEFDGEYDRPVTVGAFCSLFRPANDFAKMVFRTNEYQSFVSFSIGGGNINNLKNSDLEQFSFYIPTGAVEQKKLADTLASLNDLINAQKAKLAALQRHKRGLMQELFPAEGETLPRLRFPEFQEAEDWEKLPIGGKVDLLSGFPFKSAEISEDATGIPLMRGINVTSGFVRHSKDIDRFFLGNSQKLEKYKLRTDDLVIGMDGSKVGKNSALITEVDSGSLLIQRVARLRAKPHTSIQFIYQQINSSVFHAYVDRVNTSGGIPHISASQINEFEICFPCFEEQQKVAATLTSIDNRITAQTQKIEALKLHKKGLMQDLFPAAAEPTA